MLFELEYQVVEGDLTGHVVKTHLSNIVSVSSAQFKIAMLHTSSIDVSNVRYTFFCFVLLQPYVDIDNAFKNPFMCRQSKGFFPAKHFSWKNLQTPPTF